MHNRLTRILVDCHSFDDELEQGMNTHIEWLYKSLVPLANDCEFYFAAADIPRLRGIFGEHSRIHYIRLRSSGRIGRLLREFPAIIRSLHIDIAHFQYVAPPVKRCRYIVTLHDILFEDFPALFPRSYRWMRHLLFKRSAISADLLLTVSEYSRQRILAHYPVAADKVSITTNGVSPDFRNIDREKSRALISEKYGLGKYILHVSRFEPRKGQDILLRAYNRLRLWERGYDLVFIGNRSLPVPEYDNQLHTLSAEAAAHVHHYSNIRYDELLMWYGAASCYVYPTQAEGFGIPVIEAAAAAIPVICNNRTAMQDFSFFAPFHFDTSDEETFCERLATLLETDDPGRLEQIREQVYAKYDWQHSATTLLEKIRELLTNP